MFTGPNAADLNEIGTLTRTNLLSGARRNLRVDILAGP